MGYRSDGLETCDVRGIVDDGRGKRGKRGIRCCSTFYRAVTDTSRVPIHRSFYIATLFAT